MKSKLVFATLCIYIFFLAAFILPRKLPSTLFCKRALECASLHRLPTSPFQPYFKMQTQKICGDLAKMSHREDLCDDRPEIFITDPWGYRNTQEVWERKNDILIFGDSFAYGEGNTQENIPSEQLDKILGANVYNGAGKFELEYLAWLLDHLKTLPQTVLYFHLERHFHNKDKLQYFNKKINSGFIEQIQIKKEALFKFNPLEIVFNRFEKQSIIGNLFPNRYEKAATLSKLKNGIDTLFLNLSVERYNDPHLYQIENDLAYFIGLQNILSKKGIQLNVVLIPEKYTVYAPLLVNPPAQPSTFYLNHLNDALIKNKISVANLLPKFQTEAVELIKKNKLLYWADDTHWNPAGIALAAEEIKNSLIH